MFSTDNILAAIIFGKGKSGGEDGGGSGFSYAVSSGASDTPEGVSFYKGSSIITGALAASSAEPGRIYLVPSDNGENDNYDEYMAVQNESEEWVWEKLGNSDINVGVSAIKGSAESSYRTGDVTITKANIGLSDVDNTSDLDKPISTATQAELDKRFETQTMTMAQYNALTTAQKMDGTVRYITDVNRDDTNLFSILRNNAGSHNSFFRGDYLGDHVTAEQYAAIKAGTFNNLYIGDYWTIPVTIDGETKDVNWRIAHIDYWLRCGDTECTDHHIVIVPDTNLYTAQMNSSNTTNGGYYGSAMRGGANYPSGGNLAKAITAIESAFGVEHILNRRSYLTNAISSNTPSGGAWYDSTVDLMNEPMVYGSYIFTAAIRGTTYPHIYIESKSQLALFRLATHLICNRQWYWLQGVISSAHFTTVSDDGNANYNSASNVRGVRPAFAIYKAGD